MTHEDGSFFSALDADTEGEEGKYYVWSKEEILKTLGDDLGTLYCQVYDITEEGNFEGKIFLTSFTQSENKSKRMPG